MNAGVWPELTGPPMKKLNAAYTCVMRRIHGSMRSGGGWKIADTDVLRELGVPSLTDRLRRLRLLTLGTIINKAPVALQILLQVRGRDGERMAWAAAIRTDLTTLYQRRRASLAELGCPIEHADRWMSMIKACPAEWAEIVKTTFDYRQFQYDWSMVAPLSPDAAQFFPGQACHSSRRKPANTNSALAVGEAASACVFPCSQCGQRFPSSKAMLMHCRVKHGYRAAVQRYIGDVPRCPVCHKTFATRLRAIAHLSETRVRGSHGRPTCNSLLFSTPLVHSALIQGGELDSALASDREARRDARRQGHTQPVVGLGLCARGQRIGKLVQRPVRRLRVKTPPGKTAWVWRCQPSPSSG